MERVEQRQIALAGHAEGHLDAVDLELVDQDLAAGAEVVVLGHGFSSIGPGKNSSFRICSGV